MEHELKLFKIPRWQELPPIDLYLDQILSLMEDWLGEYMSDGEKKVMTKTMVNNYVKQKIIPPPVNKRYDKKSVASLFVIAILKSVYSINDIARLIELALGASDVENSYDEFCKTTEIAVKQAFSEQPIEKYQSKIDVRYILWNTVSSFACQLYVKKTYLTNL